MSYRPPRRVIHEYGFEVEEMFKMPTSMTGKLKDIFCQLLTYLLVSFTEISLGPCYLSTHMPGTAGSGESHTAYFYKRTNTPACCVARTGTSMLAVPARAGSLLRHSDVVCSDYFRESIELALGPVEALAEHVESVSNKILNSGRPKRERKQRNLDLL